MKKVYSYEIQTSRRKLTGQRKRAMTDNRGNAREIVMASFASDEARSGRKFPEDAKLINEIELDATRPEKVSTPPESHHGYCPVINGIIKGTYLYYEAALSKGGIVVPRNVAVKMYSFA